MDTNFATAGSGFITEEMIENSLDDSGSHSYLEDSQVSSIFINYCGDAVALPEAAALLGFDMYAAEDVLDYVLNLADEHGLISQSTYQRGLAKLLAYRYIAISVLQRSVSDYIVDRFFAILDATDSGFANAHEVGCGLLLFCDGRGAVRARKAWSLLRGMSETDTTTTEEGVSSDEEDKTADLLLVIQALSALYKAHSCLDPAVAQKQPQYKAVADNKAIALIDQYMSLHNKSLGVSHLDGSQLIVGKDFVRMFTATLSGFRCDESRGSSVEDASTGTESDSEI